MIYLYLKALHVMAVIALIGGMLVLAFALALVSGEKAQPNDREARFIALVRRWDRMVTTPALGLIWLAGIGMAIIGEWYSSPWLMIKLIPVLLLSALHGMESGTLRRMTTAGQGGELPQMLRRAVPIIFVCVVLIVFLVVTKPF
ncbi:MAG: CopD family protein [Rhizobiaceae bacterium]|nr:CopD family protein [Rhizobiaceae bacterium]